MAWLGADELLLAKGVLLGLGAAVPIGPVNVEIARRTLRGGFRAGFALGCGAVTVDVSYAVLSSIGVRLLIDRAAVLYWLILAAGVALLVGLGILCWVSAIRAFRADVARELALEQTRPSHSGGYLTGLLMTLLNPMTLAFWFTVVPMLARQVGGGGGGVAGGGVSQPAGRDLPMICLGVFIGTISWVITFAGLLAIAGRWRKSFWMVLADAFGGTTLLGFAAYTLWKSLSAHG